MTSTESTVQSKTAWLPGLDLYRALVVLLMFVVHARRVQDPISGGTPLDRIIDGVMAIEPYIAASFLFVAGVSLVLSYERAADRRRWLLRMTRRAAGLYLLAIALFVMQFGVDLPDLLASPGILSAIGIAIVVVAASLTHRRADLVLGVSAVVVLALTVALERAKLSISGLNAGPGGTFPLLAHAQCGALLARAFRRRGISAVVKICAACLVPFVGVVASGAAWTTTHVSMYTDLRGRTAIAALLSAEGLGDVVRGVSFWNHSAAGAIALLFPLAASLLLALALPQALARVRAAAAALALGRHALAAYVAHLVLLGMVELSGLAPVNAAQTWILVFALAVATWALARGLDHFRRRRPLPALGASDELSSG
jgi:uncharacterized membrane protein